MESGQNLLAKKDCALPPIIRLAEVEKWRKWETDDAEGLRPVIGVFGSSFVISLHIQNPRHCRINGGREGWYLVNLRDRKYYYCGLEREDVRVKLLEISRD